MSDNNELLYLTATSVDHWNHRGYEVIVDYNKVFKAIKILCDKFTT